MRNLNDFDECVWGRLFDFVFLGENSLTHGQVQAELRKQGIDMRKSQAKLASVLKLARGTEDARAALEEAKKRRTSLIERFAGIEVASGPNIREALRKMIAERLNGPQQAVYARKLKDAASDDDLKSLLEDITRLEEFSKDSDNGKS